MQCNSSLNTSPHNRLIWNTSTSDVINTLLRCLFKYIFLCTLLLCFHTKFQKVNNQMCKSIGLDFIHRQLEIIQLDRGASFVFL